MPREEPCALVRGAALDGRCCGCSSLPSSCRRSSSAIAANPGRGVALDCATIFVSMGLAMVMFLASRATIGLPPWLRLPLRALAVLVAAAANTIFDLLFQGFIADHFVDAWRQPAGRFQPRLHLDAQLYPRLRRQHDPVPRQLRPPRQRSSRSAASPRPITAAQQAQLAALRYQLNPHFLFNSLNSISALIVTRPQQGRRGDDRPTVELPAHLAQRRSAPSSSRSTRSWR